MKTYKVTIDDFGIQKWYNEKDLLHREDGPAIFRENYQSWWINGKCHREDGPAVVWEDGYQAWWINGNLHREDGPAVVDENGYKKWFINGKELTEQEFNKRRTKPCSGKIVVVDGIEYTLT